MASVLLAASKTLHPRLQRWGDALSIAAINGPRTPSSRPGLPTARAAHRRLHRDGIHIRLTPLTTPRTLLRSNSCANTSCHELADLAPRAARIPLYSTVGSALSGDPLDTTAMNADYWYRNLREPVRFHDGVAHLLAQGEHIFVELSPHPVLAPAISDTLAGTAGRARSGVITTLHRDRPDLDAAGRGDGPAAQSWS